MLSGIEVKQRGNLTISYCTPISLFADTVADKARCLIMVDRIRYKQGYIARLWENLPTWKNVIRSLQLHIFCVKIWNNLLAKERCADWNLIPKLVSNLESCIIGFNFLCFTACQCPNQDFYVIMPMVMSALVFVFSRRKLLCKNFYSTNVNSVVNHKFLFSLCLPHVKTKPWRMSYGAYRLHNELCIFLLPCPSLTYIWNWNAN